MKRFFQRFVAIAALTVIFQATMAQVLQPVTWQIDTKKISDDEVELVFTATIDDHWHLYTQWLPAGNFSLPTYFEFDSIVGVEFIDTVMELSEVHEAYEELAGAVSRWFEHTAVFTQKVKITGDVAYVGGYIDYMSCDDEQCIKLDEDFEFKIKGEQEQVVASEPASDSGKGSVSLWAIIIEAILWGFAALLTPCVFPMVPMTVSFFMKGSENKAKGKIMASTYGISIVLLYTLPIAILIGITYFVGGESVTADIFNWISTHWIPNLLFFLIFMIFAASFFGAFEIVLPSKLVNKADSSADKGGLLGAFFMAMTLVLVSFSCTGPIVGTIIVKSTQGEIWEPIVTMFAFSIAFALPFTLFAFFPAWLNKMPKSGGWLNSVKVVLGFVEVALGLKFLSIADQTYHWGILDREVYLAIWIVTFTLLGFYLLGKIKFAHDSDVKFISVPRLGFSIIVFAFVIYLIPGMWGAPLKALAGYLPPQSTIDFDTERIVRDNVEMGFELYGGSGTSNNSPTKAEVCEQPKYADHLHLPHGIKGFFEYNQALACAKAQNKPLFVDFTGHGCVNCREMESVVWKDPEVLKRLRANYVVVALYVDDKVIKLPKKDWIKSTYNGKMIKTLGKLNADMQITRFNINAQPYYCLLDNDGELLVDPKAYDLNVSNFIEFLDKGLENFNNKK